LIAALQEADPEGTAEVVVGGSPIYFLERLPGYYDGAYSVLIQDHTKDPYFNIIGMKFTRSGTKLKVVTMNSDDILEHDPEAIMELDPSLGEHRIKQMTENIEAAREEARKNKAELAKWREEMENKNE